MEIALLSRNRDRVGGAEGSLFNLASMLSESHDVTVYYIHEGEHGHSYGSKKLPSRLWGGKVEQYPCPQEGVNLLNILGALSLGDVFDSVPDLIVSQHQAMVYGSYMNYKHNCPHFVCLRDTHLAINKKPPLFTIAGFAKHICDLPRKPILNWLFSNTTGVLANSEYNSALHSKNLDVSPEVFYPVINPDRVKTHNEFAPLQDTNYILQINATKEKGANITLDVARRLPQEDFRFVGRADSEILEVVHSLPNVEYCGWVDSMKEIYKGAKLILIPSQWIETFGKVAIEAGLNYVPAIGSNSGGLPEAIGNESRVINSDSPSDYVSKIDEVLHNYETHSRQAKSHADQFIEESQYDQFRSIMKSYGLVI